MGSPPNILECRKDYIKPLFFQELYETRLIAINTTGFGLMLNAFMSMQCRYQCFWIDSRRLCDRRSPQKVAGAIIVVVLSFARLRALTRSHDQPG
jgi:hypothetical protein